MLWEEHERGLLKLGIADREEVAAWLVEASLRRFPDGLPEAPPELVLPPDATDAEFLRWEARVHLTVMEWSFPKLPRMKTWRAEERALCLRCIPGLSASRDSLLDRLPIAERLEWRRGLRLVEGNS